MQTFIVTFGNPNDNGEIYLMPDVIKHVLKEVGHTEFTVVEIPQPPFPSGMDTNTEYEGKHAGITIPSGYHPENAPCGASIWGTPDDIDSGIRHHMSFCSACQLIRENNGSDTP